MDAGMDTPNITTAQYGAGGLLLAVVAAALTAGVHGVDLAILTGCATIVTVALIASDVLIRRGRQANAEAVVKAKVIAAQATISAATTDTPGD